MLLQVLNTARPTVRPQGASKRCDLCGCGRFELIAHYDRNGQPLTTAMCLECGLVCHAEIPSDVQLADFYAWQYRRAYHGETVPSPRRVMRAWRNGQRILKRLRPWIPQNAKVLEVGAGIGCTVKAFQCAGYDAEGIDPGRDFIVYSRKRLLAPVEVADLYDVPPEPRYDLVLLVHVIEHFNSPRRALSHIRRLLKPTGQLYIECPNLAAPPASFEKLFHFAHVHNFTPATLRSMTEQTGFQVQHVFSSDDHPNQQVLLRCSERAGGTIDRSNVAATRRSLARSQSWARYHLRPRYVGRRVAKLAGYACEHLLGNWYVRNLERRLARISGLPAML